MAVRGVPVCMHVGMYVSTCVYMHVCVCVAENEYCIRLPVPIMAVQGVPVCMYVCMHVCMTTTHVQGASA
jgi:hypothetical protein